MYYYYCTKYIMPEMSVVIVMAEDFLHLFCDPPISSLQVLFIENPGNRS